MPFIDLDQYIELQEHRSIAEIFETEGESAFRIKENYYLTALLNHSLPCLIALGGGTICFNNTLELVKSHGVLVYIELPPAALVSRLSTNKDSRPLLRKVSQEQLFNHVSQLLNSRKTYYEQAHLKINGINLRPEHLIDEIKSFL
ncbi:MAG: shikimate kinase [Bacteroidia bacterium]|nr:shikimate kinase [Bacteroidia bacterium]